MNVGELRTPLLHSNFRSYTVQVRRGPQESDSVSDNSLVTGSFRGCDKVYLVVLLLIFCLGVAIGAYLLFTEGHEWRKTEIYNITSRELWNAHVPSSEIPKLKLPVQRVLFLQTNNSSSCDRESNCAKAVQELQSTHMVQLKQPDIMYNFVVSQDGTVFEGRGWNFQSSVSNRMLNNTVTVAFLERHYRSEPTGKEVESIELFLNAAIVEEKLGSCVTISVWQNNTFFNSLMKNIGMFVPHCEEVYYY